MARGITRGTPEQLRAALERQIATLENSQSQIDSSSSIEAMSVPAHFVDKSEREFPVDEVLKFLRSKGYDTSDKGVQNYADAVAEYMDMSRLAYEFQGEDWKYTLDQWYKDTMQNYPGEFDELARIDSATNTCGIGTNPDILQDEVYSADSDDTFYTYEVVEASDDLDFDQYLTSLADDISNAIKQDYGATTVDWTQDEDNMYITVVVGDNIYEFTVPFADLKRDESIDTEYVLKSVSETIR